MEKGQKHYLADLHTHLNEKKIKSTQWWGAAKKRKLTVIAITEHSRCRPKEAYLKLKAIKPKDIILIAGMEARTTAGDLLLYGENEKMYEIEELQKKDVKIENALKLAKENNLLASFAHPYGYKLDSACEMLGEAKVKKLLKKYKAGTEYYNGMLGSANHLLFGSKTMKKFYGLMMFFEKNKVSKALRIAKKTANTKTKIELMGENTLNRVRKPILFSKNAAFITAGSDAHYPKAIGTGIIALKRKPHSEKDFLSMLKQKQILWAGPNIYSKNPIDKIGRKELLGGIGYLTRKKVVKRGKNGLAKKIKRKIRLGKRIKTIKRITKKVPIKKIGQKLKKIRLRKKKGLGK